MGFKKGHGRFRSDESYAKGGRAQRGKLISEEHKKRIREYMTKNNPMKDANTRRKVSQSNTGKRVGTEHWSHKAGKLSVPFLNRQAKIRDDYTCQVCGLRDIEIISVDHIMPKSIYPQFLKVLENLMCLCPNCHARKTLRDRKLIAEFKRS